MPRNVDPSQTIAIGSQSASSTVVLQNHLSTNAAHDASNVYVNPPIAGATDVYQAILQMTSDFPDSPGGTGEVSREFSRLLVPDWGILKSKASGSVPNASEVYPYFWEVPTMLDDTSNAYVGPVRFPTPGEDPITDVFNVSDPSYTGGGEGQALPSAFLRGSDIVLGRTVPVTNVLGNHAVVSGTLYPADRGVLSLLYFGPSDTLTPVTNGTELSTRVVAAILLDGGVDITGSSCIPGTGGIAFYGDSPFDYPGKATGQYDLAEIHTGVGYDSNPLPSPWDTGDNTAGQVRLGTDPNAGPVVVNGLPILGGTTAARGGGNDGNYFAYRLPFLSDYSAETGLGRIPESDRMRYFNPPAYYDGEMTSAGMYPSLPSNWSFQIARYRHRFEIPAQADAGSYVLIHFKTEQDFESFVRDAVPPSEVYGVYLADPSNPEDVSNLVSIPDDFAASSYFAVRSNVYLDDTSNTDLSATTAEYGFSRTADTIMYVSGVQYFIPASDAPASSFVLNQCDLRIDGTVSAPDRGFWEGSFFTHGNGSAPFGDDRDYWKNQFCAILYLGNFASDPTATWSWTGMSPLQTHSENYASYARIDYLGFDPDGTDWSSPVTATSDAGITFDSSPQDTIEFEGDTITPSFTINAAPSVIVSTPYRDPEDWYVYSLLDTSLSPVLFHSAKAENPTYGNFVDNTYTDFKDPLPTTYSARKDVEERFLDEVYRYRSDFAIDVTGGGSNPPVLDASYETRLEGPGLIGVPTPIPIPVRAIDEPEWLRCHFVGAGDYMTDISSSNEAQVRGIRPQPVTIVSGVPAQNPSAGILAYPDLDWTAYRPSVADGDITNPQPDYSSATGDKEYVRAFDLAWSKSDPEDVAGGSEFILRFRGILSSDYAYNAPGPGSTGMAIFVKVPGTTAWLDVGRADGEGDKQDPTFDGAGCRMEASETYDGTDGGYVFSQVKVNVAPATLFLNNQGECPILVKVVIKDTVHGRSLSWYQGTDRVDSDTIRGLFGMQVIRLSDAFVTSADLDRRFDTGLADVVSLDTGVITVFES